MPRTVIVIPCYNEAARLDVGAFEHFVAKRHDVHFVLVNDGSEDATLARIEAMHATDPAHFSVFDRPRNAGKAAAVREGVLHALGGGAGPAEFVGYWDADLATPLAAIDDFVALLAERPELEMVSGARVKSLGRSIERRPLRHYVGRILATAASLVLRLGVYDTQCGAKLFRAGPIARGLFERPFVAGWMFDVEILARLVADHRARGGPAPERVVYEIPLAEWRHVGGSKIRPADGVRALVELFSIWRRYMRDGPGRGGA